MVKPVMMYSLCLFVLIQLLNIIEGQPRWNNVGSEQWSREYGFYSQRNDPNVCSYETCRLPKCFCAGKDSPKKMDPSVIPQIVMFTFDDAVNEQVFDHYLELFPEESVNPNGCPVSVTFFVSHNWTDYGMVKKLYDRGHEIASHSITHRMPQSWWRYGPAEDWEMEIKGQRDNIVQKASIPVEEVRGMRAPFLDTGGDEQFKMLEKHGFEYDASFMTGPHDKGGAWPFTMNYVPSWEYCTNLNCPKEKHPGIWEVPLNRWVGIDGNGCSMVDACQQQPSHKGETLAYLWQNFNRHYYGNRSPVGVNMHATWFKTPHHFEAMKEFVKTISEMNDVYIITVHQTLQWIQNPQTIDRVANFHPWLKTCKDSPPKTVKLDRTNPKPDVVQTSIIEAKELDSQNFEDSRIFIENVDKQQPTNSDFNYVPRRPSLENVDHQQSTNNDFNYVPRRPSLENVDNQQPTNDDFNFVPRRPSVENFENNQPNNNDLNYIPRRFSVEQGFTDVQRSNNRRPVNMENEIIQDYRFTERRVSPLAISNSGISELQFTNERQRPVVSREMTSFRRQQISENFPRFHNVGSDEMIPEVKTDNSPIFPEEIERYESYENNNEAINVEDIIPLVSQNENNIVIEADRQYEKTIIQGNSDVENIAPKEKEDLENLDTHDTSSDRDEIIQQSSNTKQLNEIEQGASENKANIIIAEKSEKPEKSEEAATPAIITKPVKELPKSPTRPRQRPFRPRQGGIPGRTDLQSRQRNRGAANSASLNQLNIVILTTSGTIAVYLYQQVAWL